MAEGQAALPELDMNQLKQQLLNFDKEVLGAH